jgi:hypothetical protein
MPTQITGEMWLHIGQLAGLVLVAWIVLKIDNSNKASKIERLEMKEELIGGQTEMRADMDAKHSENKQALAVHAGVDEAKFDALGRTLQRIDNTLIRMDERTK